MQHRIRLFSAGYCVELCSARFTTASRTFTLQLLLGYDNISHIFIVQPYLFSFLGKQLKFFYYIFNYYNILGPKQCGVSKLCSASQQVGLCRE